MNLASVPRAHPPALGHVLTLLPGPWPTQGLAAAAELGLKKAGWGADGGPAGVGCAECWHTRATTGTAHPAHWRLLTGRFTALAGVSSGPTSALLTGREETARPKLFLEDVASPGTASIVATHFLPATSSHLLQLRPSSERPRRLVTRDCLSKITAYLTNIPCAWRRPKVLRQRQ